MNTDRDHFIGFLAFITMFSRTYQAELLWNIS